MYHPEIARKRLDRLVDLVRKRTDPLFEPRISEIKEIDGWIARLEGVFDSEKGLKRALSEAEQRFILNEVTISKADFSYWAARYPRIKTKEQTLSRIVLLESQEIILERVAAAELAAVSRETGDGILLAILKARQLGASTLTEAMIAHRCFFYSNTTALVAGDVPEQSAYLFDMIERVYDNLPWWMRPELTFHVKDRQMWFGPLDSLILVESGKSVRGGSDLERGRGQMGRGKTYPLVHGSEISTWENTEQIDDSLLPAIPEHPRTLAIFESTARGRGNYWHNAWILAKKGLGRFTPVFIPWYAESRTYTRPAPLDWHPSEIALAHALKAREVSARWCGRSIALTRDQLFWWERKRAEAIEKKNLHVFLAEYCADDLEAFQNTSRSVFPAEVLHELRQHARDPHLFDLEVRGVTQGLA
jgi:hypothetical protein